MPSSSEAFPTQPEVDRDRWGRPLVVPPGGGAPTAYTRCTTYVGCLDDTFGLSKWQQRMVGVGMAMRNDLVLAMSPLVHELSTTPSELVSSSTKTAADKIVEQAKDIAAAGAAATTGTALHALTERLDRGQPLGSIPPQAAADIEAYRIATEPLTALHIERFTVLDELKIGGTPDRIVELDDQHYIADLKTGSVKYAGLKIAMQLAVYAHSRFYDPKTKQRTDLPRVDQKRAIVIHAPAGTGTATLLWVDIEQGWEAVQIARQVRYWRTQSGRLLSPLGDVVQMLPLEDSAPASSLGEDGGAGAVQPLPQSELTQVRNAVASAASVEELGALWRAHRAVWDDDLTQLAAARKALLAGKLVK
jgi:hypothetical protein